MFCCVIPPFKGLAAGLNEVSLSTDATTVHFTLTALCTEKRNRHPAIS